MKRTPEEVNAARRERYQNDPEYRARLARHNHNAYMVKRQERIAYIKTWRKANPEKVAIQRAAYHERSKVNGKYREGHIRRRYGITPEQESALWEAQRGLCAICGKTLSGPGERDTHLDHNHTTGKVRGFLCVPCNLGIGHLQDDPALLLIAVEYLNRP